MVFIYLYEDGTAESAREVTYSQDKAAKATVVMEFNEYNGQVKMIKDLYSDYSESTPL